MSVISLTAREQSLKNFTVHAAVEAAKLRVQAYVDSNFDDPQQHMYQVDISAIRNRPMDDKITIVELNEISDTLFEDTIIYL